MNAFLFWIKKERTLLVKSFVDNGFDIDKIDYSHYRLGMIQKLKSLWHEGFDLGLKTTSHPTISTFSTISDLAEFADDTITANILSKMADFIYKTAQIDTFKNLTTQAKSALFDTIDTYKNQTEQIKANARIESQQPGGLSKDTRDKLAVIRDADTSFKTNNIFLDQNAPEAPKAFRLYKQRQYILQKEMGNLKELSKNNKNGSLNNDIAKSVSRIKELSNTTDLRELRDSEVGDLLLKASGKDVKNAVPNRTKVDTNVVSKPKVETKIVPTRDAKTKEELQAAAAERDRKTLEKYGMGTKKKLTFDEQVALDKAREEALNPPVEKEKKTRKPRAIFIPVQKPQALAEIEQRDATNTAINKKMTEVVLNQNDFGRVYLENRLDSLARTFNGYEAASIKESLTRAVNTEKGDGAIINENDRRISSVIQRYFEKTFLKYDPTTGQSYKVIGGNELPINLTTPKPGLGISGQRTKGISSGETVEKLYKDVERIMFPNKQDIKNKALAYLTILEQYNATVQPEGRLNSIDIDDDDVKYFGIKKGGRMTRKQLIKLATADVGELSDLLAPRIKRMIVTELHTAHHLGRISSMYANKTELVRWIVDVKQVGRDAPCKRCIINGLKNSKLLGNANIGFMGVFYLHEMLTDKTLALPRHPHCKCYIRPLTNKEMSDVMTALGDATNKTAEEAFLSVVENAAKGMTATMAMTKEEVYATHDKENALDKQLWTGLKLGVGAGVTVLAAAALIYNFKKVTPTISELVKHTIDSKVTTSAETESNLPMQTLASIAQSQATAAVKQPTAVTAATAISQTAKELEKQGVLTKEEATRGMMEDLQKQSDLDQQDTMALAEEYWNNTYKDRPFVEIRPVLKLREHELELVVSGFQTNQQVYKIEAQLNPTVPIDKLISDGMKEELNDQMVLLSDIKNPDTFSEPVLKVNNDVQDHIKDVIRQVKEQPIVTHDPSYYNDIYQTLLNDNLIEKLKISPTFNTTYNNVFKEKGTSSKLDEMLNLDVEQAQEIGFNGKPFTRQTVTNINNKLRELDKQITILDDKLKPLLKDLPEGTEGIGTAHYIDLLLRQVERNDNLIVDRKTFKSIQKAVHNYGRAKYEISQVRVKLAKVIKKMKYENKTKITPDIISGVSTRKEAIEKSYNISKSAKVRAKLIRDKVITKETVEKLLEEAGKDATPFIIENILNMKVSTRSTNYLNNLLNDFDNLLLTERQLSEVEKVRKDRLDRIITNLTARHARLIETAEFKRASAFLNVTAFPTLVPIPNKRKYQS